MKSVLSIQSHVVHGYVGGRAVIFPLQTQGWEVDNINTVHFSNHTGYGQFRGQVLGREELASILDQLIKRLHIGYNAVITGYVPNSELISCIREYIVAMKQDNDERNTMQVNGHPTNGNSLDTTTTTTSSSIPSPLIYLMDPVMGDDNYMYVDQSCVDEYRKLIHSQLVDIITPNQFELELLMDQKITNRDSLTRAITQLHEQCHIPYIAITSVESQVITGQQQDFIYCVISTKSSPQQSTNFNQRHDMRMFKIPTIKSYFTGVGDLFSALLLDKFVANQDESTNLKRLSKSVNQVLTIMAKTLKLTHKLGMQQAKAALSRNNSNTNSNGTRNGGGMEALLIDDARDAKDAEVTGDTEDEIVGKINDGETMKYFELKVIQAKEFYNYTGDGEFEELEV
ncbi:BUD16 [Candida margitis]|uniref:BUD16 n=1 Tax=Candida margitis TaxID=1775924 RepID=UPI002227A075|nr:BUD16 [Candida margitis]KAI5955419.1 BUD16 [Candida margitis]